MDKIQFYNKLSKIKYIIELGECNEHRLHCIDFFSLYNEIAPHVFTEYESDILESPGFKAQIWQLMSQLIGMDNDKLSKEPPKDSNVIDFISLRKKLRA